MPGLDFLNFYDKDKIYKEEGKALSDDRTKIDFDFGDRLRHLGASMLGRGDEFSEEALLKGARKEVVDTYNNDPKRLAQIKTIQQSLGGTEVDLTGLQLPETGITEAQQTVELAGKQALGQSVASAYAQNPEYFDKSNVTSMADVDTETTRAIGEKNNDPTNPTSRASVSKKEEDAEGWRKLMFESQRQDAREAQLHRQYLAEQNAADRKANRELQREQNQQTLQLAIMDRQDRKEDRRIAREDRAADKRQQSIMMLIKGLTQLGAGFSI